MKSQLSLSTLFGPVIRFASKSTNQMSSGSLEDRERCSDGHCNVRRVFGRDSLTGNASCKAKN